MTLDETDQIAAAIDWVGPDSDTHYNIVEELANLFVMMAIPGFNKARFMLAAGAPQI